jgi:beta-lactamase class A
MKRVFLSTAAFCLLVFVQIAWSAEAVLEKELARLADVSGGTMGVAVVHLESGRSAFLNADDSFPMASTYKVPIATQLLTLVDDGRLSLTKMINIKPSHLSPGSGTISTLLDDPGVSISLHNLLELMLLISDNSATDIILAEAGGGEAVTDRMQSMDLDDIRVDRPTLGIIADFLGLEELPPPSARTRAGYEKIFEAIPEEVLESASAEFDKDPRDTATPRDMALLLEKIWRGQGSRASCRKVRWSLTKPARSARPPTMSASSPSPVTLATSSSLHSSRNRNMTSRNVSARSPKRHAQRTTIFCLRPIYRF